MRPNSTRSILVVDDSVHDYETYVRFLSKGPKKFKTKYMCLGNELLASTPEPPDCVLLDLSLPDTSGLEVLKKLKEEHQGALPFPIVMVTGSGDQQTGEQAVKLGAQDYLVKEDVTHSSLLRSIEFAMTRFQLEQQLRDSEVKHRAMAESLKVSEERFRRIFENAVTGIAITDFEGHFLNCNPPYCNLLGYSQEELRQLSVFELLHPEDREGNKIARERLRTGEISHLERELRLMRKDGEVIWVQKIVSLLPEKGAEAIHFLSMLTDITERRHSEERLRRSAETFEALVEQSPLGIYTVDSDFRIRNVSVGAMAAFRTVKPVIGRDFAEVMHTLWPESFANDAIKIFRRTLETGEGYISPGLTELRSDIGEIESYEWQTIRVTLADGKYGVVCYYFDSTRLQKANRALRESEERVRLATQVAELGIWHWDPNKDVAMWENERMYEITGRSRENGPINSGEFIEKVVHPADRGVFVQSLRKTVETGGRFFFNGRIVRPDSELRWIEFSGRIDPPAEGSERRMIGTMLDITERKLADEALRKSEERNRLLAAQMSQAAVAAELSFWSWDIAGGEILPDEHNRLMLGLPPTGPVTFVDFISRIHPSDRANLQNEITFCLRTGATYDSEFRVLTSDASPRWIAARGAVVMDSDGTPVEMRGIAIDITRRKVVEEKLRAAEQRIRIAQQAARSGTWEWNLQNGQAIWSEELEVVYGLPAGSFSGKLEDWRPMVHPEDLEKVEALAGEVIKSKTDYYSQFRIRRLDGEERWIEAFAKPFYDDRGQPVRMIGVNIDITERKKVEQELEQSRNLLESRVEERTKDLAGALERVEEQVAVRKAAEDRLRELSARLLRTQDEERRRIARELHDSTGQTLAALKMEIARVQGEIKQRSIDPGSLNESNSLADQAIAEIRTISHLLHPPLLDEVGFTSAARWYAEGFEKRSGIKVTLEMQDLQLSRSASLALFRILQESFTNVLRHSGAAAVDVQLRISGDDAVLSIKDFGKGIPAEQIATFMKTGGGVGIGLGGMRERLKQLGGQLELLSEEGTTVVATLPLRGIESQEAPDISAA